MVRCLNVVAIAAGLLTVAQTARGGTSVTNLDFDAVAVTQPGYYAEGAISRFDPALGTLTDVTLTVTGTITGTAYDTPALNVDFADRADHLFSLYGIAFSTSGPITPAGTTFSLTTEDGYAAENVALFDHLSPGTTLSTFLFANGFDGEVDFTSDTLAYTYTQIPEPMTAVLLFCPVLALCCRARRVGRRTIRRAA